MWMGLTLLAPPEPATVPVAVASRALSPGLVLSEDDLAEAQLPASLAPATALPRSAVVGRSLSSARATGEMVTSTALLGDDLLLGAEDGQLAMPLPVTDTGAAHLLVPGDTIDVLAAVPSATGTDVVVAAQDVTILRTPAAHPAGPGGSAAGSALATSPGIGSGSIAGTVGSGSVVVAVTPQQAQALVAGASDGSLWVAVRPRP
jgi:Flp pilus assembly protein CpaB